MTKNCICVIVASLFLMFGMASVLAQTAEAPGKSDQKEQKPDDKPTQTPAKKTDGSATKDVAPIKIAVAQGALNFDVPGTWKKKTPKVNMIESEFEIPAAKGDEVAGRITFMAAGGSVQANIDRWIGQFEQPEDCAVDEPKIEKKKIADLDVHLVTLSGTYMDGSGGPFGPKTEREDYMMLAAIIETTDDGLYFIKSYGGTNTMQANKKGFEKMIDSMTIKK